MLNRHFPPLDVSIYALPWTGRYFTQDHLGVLGIFGSHRYDWLNHLYTHGAIYIFGAIGTSGGPSVCKGKLLACMGGPWDICWY